MASPEAARGIEKGCHCEGAQHPWQSPGTMLRLPYALPKKRHFERSREILAPVGLQASQQCVDSSASLRMTRFLKARFAVDSAVARLWFAHAVNP